MIYETPSSGSWWWSVTLIVGQWQTEVAKRVDIFATALCYAMTVDGILDLDLSYTPPMGAP